MNKKFTEAKATAVQAIVDSQDGCFPSVKCYNVYHNLFQSSAGRADEIAEKKAPSCFVCGVVPDRRWAIPYETAISNGGFFTPLINHVNAIAIKLRTNKLG